MLCVEEFVAASSVGIIGHFAGAIETTITASKGSTGESRAEGIF